MKINSQISLYLLNGSKYDELDITRKLIELYPELDKPVIFTENSNFPAEANVPIFVFDKNTKLQIIGNYYYITINCSEDYVSKISEITNFIVEYLLNFNIKMYRLGYVNIFMDGKNKIDEIKRRFLKEDKILKSEDFEISWLSYIDINSTECNCWQRYYIDKSNDKLNNLIDINTKEGIDVTIDCEYVKAFIKNVNMYIEEERKN